MDWILRYIKTLAGYPASLEREGVGGEGGGGKGREGRVTALYKNIPLILLHITRMVTLPLRSSCLR